MEQAISADSIEAIKVTATHELVERHGNRSPADLALAQYSVPFCVALGCIRDARDPRAFDDSALSDSRIRAMLARVTYVADEALQDPMGCEVTLRLKNGAVHKQALPPIPNGSSPRANRDQVYEKYSILTSDLPRAPMDEVFERVQTLEDQANLRWLAP